MMEAKQEMVIKLSIDATEALGTLEEVKAELKEIAELKGQVSERLAVQADEEIINGLIESLQKAIRQSLDRGKHEDVASIAKATADLIVLRHSLFPR